MARKQVPQDLREGLIAVVAGLLVGAPALWLVQVIPSHGLALRAPRDGWVLGAVIVAGVTPAYVLVVIALRRAMRRKRG
jgi:hypothetical protein